MQTTQMGKGEDVSLTGLLDAPSLWALLFQGEMGSRRVVVGKIGTEEAFQVAVVQDDDVIETLAPDRADQALDIGILPG